LGAYGLIFNVGDWGWLIGASVGGLIYRALSREQSSVSVIVGAGE